MTADIKTRTVARESANAAVDTVTRATLTGLGAVSGLVGLWAVACMVGAVVTNGPGAVALGFVSALF